MRALSRTWGDVWTPLVDLDMNKDKAKNETFWIVDVTDQEVLAVACRGADYPKVRSVLLLLLLLLLLYFAA